MIKISLHRVIWSLCVILTSALMSCTIARANSPEIIQVRLSDVGFTPSNIVSRLNRPVSIHVINVGKSDHQFSIPYYRIYSRTLHPGESSDITFAPWDSGTFDMMSDPVGDEHAEFTGHFLVRSGLTH